MQPVPRVIVDAFAAAFAAKGRSSGFSAQEISDYFCELSASVHPLEHYGVKPAKRDLFVDCLYSLTPEAQYCALHDLTAVERESSYTYPIQSLRDRLSGRLHSSLAIEPVGLAYSKLRSSEFRRGWMTAYTRLSTNPAAAVTAARTLLETVFKTIVSERGGTPDESGDLGRLMRQAQDAVGFLRRNPANQSEHQIIQGLTGVIGGVAGVSNAAGDRHGTAQGVTLQDKYLAVLCVHACGAVGLSFIEKHLFAPMQQPQCAAP